MELKDAGYTKCNQPTDSSSISNQTRHTSEHRKYVDQLLVSIAYSSCSVPPPLARPKEQRGEQGSFARENGKTQLIIASLIDTCRNTDLESVFIWSERVSASTGTTSLTGVGHAKLSLPRTALDSVLMKMRFGEEKRKVVMEETEKLCKARHIREIKYLVVSKCGDCKEVKWKEEDMSHVDMILHTGMNVTWDGQLIFG
ncbi:hypothetical protein CR513_16923, partial [Mucuna pruriens]